MRSKVTLAIALFLILNLTACGRAEAGLGRGRVWLIVLEFCSRVCSFLLATGQDQLCSGSSLVHCLGWLMTLPTLTHSIH